MDRSSVVTITRKIQLNINCDDKEKRSEYYSKLKEWSYAVRVASNIVASHWFVQKNLTYFSYLSDDVKLKVSDILKQEKGNSETNTTYRVISKINKGNVPSDIQTCLNNSLRSTLNKKWKNIVVGKASLSSFENEQPIPFSARSMINLCRDDEGNYSFVLHGIPFKTYFGRDLSGNKAIMDRAIKGEYKLCNSSIQIKKIVDKDTGLKRTKIFLLAVFQFEQDVIYVDQNKSITCLLDPTISIIIKNGRGSGEDYFIGSGEFLHRRLAIKAALKRMQSVSKYTAGGRGRTHKLRTIERFKEKEKNYVHTQLHRYSHLLIQYCLKNKVGKIILDSYTDTTQEVKKAAVERNSKEDKEILATWSYYGLATMIEYKAKMNGILVVKNEIESYEE